VLEWLKKRLRRERAESGAGEGLKRAYPAINKAAGELLHGLGPAFTNTPEGHIQTDIAAAASLAGSVLLREAVPDLERYPAGQVILSDTHHRQRELLGFMGAVAPGMGLAADGWDGSVPTGQAPLLDVVTMIGKLQDSLEQIVTRHRIPAEYRAHVAALSAMKLVGAGQGMAILDQQIGKALASYYLVAGSKTVPPSYPRS
jgi:hypothetical protein